MHVTIELWYFHPHSVIYIFINQVIPLLTLVVSNLFPPPLIATSALLWMRIELHRVFFFRRVFLLFTSRIVANLPRVLKQYPIDWPLIGWFWRLSRMFYCPTDVHKSISHLHC